LFVGHSLGEYSAMVASSKIKFSDCLKIVAKRNKHLSSFSEYCMFIAIGIKVKFLQLLLRKLKFKVYICLSNSKNKHALITKSIYEFKLKKFLNIFQVKLVKLLNNTISHNYLLKNNISILSNIPINLSDNDNYLLSGKNANILIFKYIKFTMYSNTVSRLNFENIIHYISYLPISVIETYGK
jgi:hypothetical protein